MRPDANCIILWMGLWEGPEGRKMLWRPSSVLPEPGKRPGPRSYLPTLAGPAQAGFRASCQARGSFRKLSTSDRVAASKAPEARASARTSHQVQR